MPIIHTHRASRSSGHDECLTFFYERLFGFETTQLLAQMQMGWRSDCMQMHGAICTVHMQLPAGSAGSVGAVGVVPTSELESLFVSRL